MRHKGIGLKVTMLGPRVMSALQVWLWLLLFIFQNEFRISYAAEPGYLDFDNLPETNFSCAGKVIGGYYADLETDCQMFHVCTIGQLEEPMDIKFLCLNGTVFDQETRVCERVDEVDCSKSEQFYSLNLELYGNTAPPIIKAVTDEPDDGDNGDEEYDDGYDDTSTTPKTTTTSTTTTTTPPSTTTTKRPTTTTARPYFTTSKPAFYQTTVQQYHSHQDDDGDIEEDTYDIIDEDIHLNEPNKTSNAPKSPSSHHNTHYNSDSQVQRPSTGNQNNQFVNYATQSNNQNNPKPTKTNENSQIFSPEEFIYHHNNQEYHHKSPAISFQQQSYSNDGQNSHVTVTTHVGGTGYNTDSSKATGTRNNNSHINKSFISNSTPKNFVEKSSNFNSYPSFSATKRPPLVPPNTQSQAPTGHPGISTPKRQKEPLYFSFPKPSLIPQGFKPNQSIQSQQHLKPSIHHTHKPLQSYQSSETHEISLESDYEFDKLTPSYPFIHQDFSNYHYDHKRSQSTGKYDPNEATTKSDHDKITTPTPYYNLWATRSNNYTKSLPRVIVTASASVSDSNGKKLNYTVGNIVHAVKPLVPTNYDDYKESDVLLDPFFLDVPKLKKPRNKRSNLSKLMALTRAKRQTVIKVYKYDVASKAGEIALLTPKTSIKTDNIQEKIPLVFHNTDMKKENTEKEKKDEKDPWLPPDYVDDNYEPLVYDEANSKINNNFHIQLTESSEIKATMNTPLEDIFETSSQEITNLKTHKTNFWDNSKVDLTTENNVAKTTLDFVKIETTTSGFLLPSRSRVSKYEQKKYRLNNVQIINLGENNSNGVKHFCSDKKYNKFYPDKHKCRTFYMCTPGKSAMQVLNMVFICDLGTYFDKDIENCTVNKPNNCEL